MSQANEDIQEAWDDEEGGAIQDAQEEHPGQGDDVEVQEVHPQEEEALQDEQEEHPGQGDDVEVQGVQRHLPVASFPLPLATEEQLQEAMDPGTQGDKGPGVRETSQNLDGFERRDGSAIRESERPRRVKRPVNKFE